MENDHNYIASRSASAVLNSDQFELQVARIRRRFLAYNAQDFATVVSNSDHDYLYAPQGASSSQNGGNQNVLSGTVQGDQDLFHDDEENNGNANYIVQVTDDSSSSTVTSHSRSATPTNTTTSGSDSSTSLASSESTLFSNASNSTQTSAIISNISPATLSLLRVMNERSNGNRSNADSSNEDRSNAGLDDIPSTSRGRHERAASTLTSAAVQEAQPQENSQQTISRDQTLLAPNSPPRKRNRLSLENSTISKSNTPKVNTKTANCNDEDEDDGLTCPICLDSWEMSGEHRLTSLKCGHLFGEACIRRWLKENTRLSGQRACPQCKTKADLKDIRYLYAKRLRAIDRSEEHRMRDELCNQRSKYKDLELEMATIKMTYTQSVERIRQLESDNEILRKMVGNPTSGREGGIKPLVKYKLFLDKTIDLYREPGCRVLKYADRNALLILSQKSPQGLFPGYGLKFLDTPTFKPTNFLHTSVKIVRDVSLLEEQQLLAVTSMEQKVKLFDMRSLQIVAQFKPSEKPIWSCALGRRERENYIYLGSQHGSTYVYDIRFPEIYVDELVTEGECNPVINVATVPECDKFPLGACIVCKLTTLWLYEYQPGADVKCTRLASERFISMSYVSHNQSLLVQTRSCERFPFARFILGTLDRVDGIPVFKINATFTANTKSPVMIRATQVDVDSNSLVAGYIQDTKKLLLFDASTEKSIQTLPVRELIFDICPIYLKDMTYLAALSEGKCRVYKLNAH